MSVWICQGVLIIVNRTVISHVWFGLQEMVLDNILWMDEQYCGHSKMLAVVYTASL